MICLLQSLRRSTDAYNSFTQYVQGHPYGNVVKYMNAETFNKHVRKKHDCTTSVPNSINADIDDASTMKLLKRKSPATDCDPFSMSEGTQKVLKLDSERRAFHAASSLDCDPLALHLSRKDMANSLIVYGLFHVNDINNISSRIPCEAKSFSSPMECTIQFHKDTYEVKSCAGANAKPDNAILTLKQTVRNSFHPELMSKNGNFSEPNEELLGYLNFDFRTQPSLLHMVAELHTGAVIADKEIIFVIAAEAYGRAKATDVHAEANMKSVPTPSNSLYGSLSVGIHEEADGGSVKRKLKVGSKTMNILVTMSVRLRSENPLDIGPESGATPQQIHPSTAQILYRDTRVEQFLKVMRDHVSYTMPRSLSSLRQLVSGFGDRSTFFRLRATHEEFNVDLMVPSTVFTLCDTPHNQGYGASAHSTAKLASRFLQCLALSVIAASPTPDFSTALDAFKTAEALKSIQEKECKEPKSAKNWETLSSFVTKLERQLEHTKLPPSVLGVTLDFDSLAAIAGQSISTSNQRIKENVIN